MGKLGAREPKIKRTHTPPSCAVLPMSGPSRSGVILAAACGLLDGVREPRRVRGRLRSQFLVSPLLAVVGLLPSACTGGPTESHLSPAVVDHFKGLPRGVAVPLSQRQGSFPRELRPWATWASAHTIFVMTWGSGSCPRIPTSVDLEGSDRIRISTVEHDLYEGCTDDLAVTTSEVRLPSEISGTGGLLVDIDGTTTRLPARF
jgi:hypothetical protein